MMLAMVGQHALAPTTGDASADPKEAPPAAWQDGDATQAPVSAQTATAEVRSCELCGATQTPMWRRGPSGKGSVCNACGVRWASRRRGSRKPIDDSAVSHAKEYHTAEGEATGGALEQYYCKYCGLTWPLNFFKNRQQFGAHCSNCSRKRKSRDTLPNATSSNDMALSPRELGTSPTGPFLPHLNLRAAIPAKMPHDVHFAHHKFSDYTGDHDDLEDMYPPAKKYKSLPSNGHPSSSAAYGHAHQGHSHSGMDSGDETYCDSDSETVTSPYGPSANSLYRLLGAVENVLTEEREMATTLNQMQAVRAMIDSLDETRKTTLAHLEQSLLERLEHIQNVVAPAQVVALIERQRQAVQEPEVQTSSLDASAGVTGPSVNAEATSGTSVNDLATVGVVEVQSNAMEGVTPMEVSVKLPVEVSGSEMAVVKSSEGVAQEEKEGVEVKPVEEVAGPVEEVKKEVEEATSKEDERLLSSSILAVESAEKHIEAAMGPHVEVSATVEVPSVNLPAELEKAAHELVAVFTNATLLQMGSAADIEQFKNCFVHVLSQSKASINQDVAALFEALVALKQRQTQLGQGTFIDHMQLRALSNDVHALKQRVVNSSRTVQAMFVQLVTQFSEQIEAAKRIYQENAGNQVRLLDEVVRTSLTPALSREVDQLRAELLAHINCVHTNLAYLDSLVLNVE